MFILPEICLAQQFNFTNYSVKEGVAQSQVYALLQDKRGFLWMGTRGGGLSKYDGINFKTFTEKDGLSNNYIYDIKQDKNGNLWIGTNNGLTFYNGRRFRKIPVIGSNALLEVREIAFDAKNRQWLATNNGLYLLDGKKTISVSSLLRIPKTITTSVLIDRQGQVWFGTGNGLFRVWEVNGKFSVEKMGNSNHFLNNAITKIREDKEGKLWIGTYGDGVYVKSGKRVHRIDLQQELYKQTILDIYFSDDNTVFLATLSKGVCQYNVQSKSFSWLTENEGLSNNHVRSIIRDNTGNYWFGTSGGGVCKYFGKQFTTYDKSSGLAGNFIYSIFRDSQGRLWVGNSQKGVSMLKDNVFQGFSAENGFVNEKIKAISEDRFGRVYFGTDGSGVFVYDEVNFVPIPELRRKYIRAIIRDREDNLWVATAGTGIYKINIGENGYEIENFTTEQGLLNNRITCLHQDKKGRIWYGTENYGIGFIANGQVSKDNYTSERGLASNIIRCFTEDQSGNLWVGTAGSGISAIEIYKAHMPVRSYGLKDNLTSANIYLLVCDEKNNLMAGSESGLDLIRFNGKNIRSIRHFGRGDGFTGIETCQNSVFKDDDGSIWFGTINGLSRYNPTYTFKNQFEPVISLTDIKLFYESLDKTAFKSFLKDWNQVRELQLPYDQNHLTFNFFAVNLSNPEAVKYQWKLLGFDEHWSPVSKDNTILYSNINPGKYTFLVKACNEDGIWNKTPLSIKIEISTPFWMTWWFRSLVVFSAILLLFLFFFWQLKRTKAKALEDNKRLQMEKDFLELEQKALRLQMNPHFIFNALNSIQGLIGTGNEQQARYYLAKFSRLMRQILDNSRNTFITLEEEINTLENYLIIEQFCNGNKFDYEISVDESLEKDYIKIPPMLVQPFVENAIKHGMKKYDGQHRGFIRINFDDREKFLECTITDNGIGREKAEELIRSSMETYHQSTSFLVTRERLDLLQENLTQENFEIIDLHDASGEASGTQVIIRIPIN